MPHKLIIGNWKMNPATVEEAQKIARKTRLVASQLSHTEVVICPPQVFIPKVISKNNSALHIGAQTVSVEEDGAHTGEVGALMLKNSGVEYVIVGHSEQRLRGDTDEVVARRLKMVLAAGMKAVVCVGESVRDEGGAYLETLKNQIRMSLQDAPSSTAHNIVMAYEPVWAIGAKDAMQPEQIYEMSLFVRKVFSDVFNQRQAMKVPVLYGGAVNFRNAADIMTIGKVDGLLVGRESINMPGFTELLRSVDGV